MLPPMFWPTDTYLICRPNMDRGELGSWMLLRVLGALGVLLWSLRKLLDGCSRHALVVPGEVLDSSCFLGCCRHDCIQEATLVTPKVLLDCSVWRPAILARAALKLFKSVPLALHKTPLHRPTPSNAPRNTLRRPSETHHLATKTPKDPPNTT